MNPTHQSIPAISPNRFSLGLLTSAAKKNSLSTAIRLLLPIVTCAVLFPTIGCQSVGKPDSFKKFKDNAVELKKETNDAFSMTGLDLSRPTKNEILDLAQEQAATLADQNAASAAKLKAESDLKIAEKALAEAKAKNAAQADIIKLEESVRSVKAKIASEQNKITKAVNAGKKLAVDVSNRLDRLDVRANSTAQDPFSWGTTSMPSFIELKRMQSSVSEAVTLFEEYSDLLHQLSNPELVDDGRFEKMAVDLNDSARSLFVNRLGVSDGSEIALFSAAAISFARSYIKDKKARELQRLLECNQPTIDTYAVLMQDALEILRNNIDKYYSDEYEMARKVIQQNLAVGAESDRATAIGELITLNDNYINLMAKLKALHIKYGKISNDHLRLSESIVSPSLSLTYVTYTSDEASDFADTFQAADSLNQYQSALLVAKRSDALAKKFERSATEAEAKTTLAKAKMDIAKGISGANPNDVPAKKKVEELQEAHMNLKVVSDDLRAKATYYRSLAKLDKADADSLKPVVSTDKDKK